MKSEFLDWCGAAGLALTPEQQSAFDAFEEALYAHNAVKNLTRIPREEAWRRHFVDSLMLQELIPFGARVLDLGSGPGFPAWPLALARKDLEVTALDSNGKMLDFLRSQQLANLDIVQGRAEDWGVRDEFDFVTGRAFSPLAIQLEVSAAPCRMGGVVVPMRTAKEKAEITGFPAGKLGLTLVDIHRRQLPGEEAIRLFPMFAKRSPTPKQYPRSWAEIKAKPIARV